MTASAASSPAPPHSRRPSIISPAVDTLLVGGLSLIAFIPLLLSGRTDLVLVSTGAQAWLAAMLNMPHFLASYRIVYRSKAMILKHKWASIYIPAILALWIMVAIWQAQRSPAMVTILMTVASGYLAWHYTGQIWGMMATYAHLDGNPFDRTEYLLIRNGLRILLTWHVTWFLHSADLGLDLAVVYRLMTWLTLVALAMGSVGLHRMWRRTGRLPPVRALVAWAAIFVWYAAMARDPRAIFWVQIAHAIQYLMFPVRVELNHTVIEDDRQGRPSHLVRHMLVYGFVLLGLSYLMSNQVPESAMVFVAQALGERPGQVAPMMLLAFLNIHHYFTDGVIWKIGDPEVRRELFAHVPRPDASPHAGGRKARKA